jgi:hypothetical protein
MLPKQGVLWRRPNARDVLKGKDEHTEPIEYLQVGTMAQGDFRDSLRHGGRDIGDDQENQDRINDARGGLSAATVFKDLENAMAQSLSFFWICVH